MKPAQTCVTFGSLNKGRDANREGRVDEHLGDMPHHCLNPLAWRPRHGARRHLHMEGFESVSDQGELVGPVPIDRGLPDSRTAGNGLDPKGAVPDFTELIERRLQYDLTRSFDPGVDGTLRRRSAAGCCHGSPSWSEQITVRDVDVSLRN